MSTPTNLAAISSFEQLLPYLEANLDWPTKQYSFEDLTFEFEPEELGLKDADAAKIKTIHQLRPLKASQPFGIFFVEFENKKLPVVVLRRILSHLALKKRASANKIATPAWHAQDIIFVSAFGEDNTAQRELAFAHFHQTENDLPTLRVLGWDGADTKLKLDQVDKDLRTCLHWPDDESDTAQWRAKWTAAFKHRQGYVIRTANELAQTLALFARQIRDAAVTMLEAESERGAFRKLYKGFKTALIHDLTEEAFADTYAQTITYGLLTAAISRTDKVGEEGTALVADNIADMVPVTNPFLKDMLETFLHTGGRKRGINFDELGIQDVVDLLRDREKTDLAAVLRDFNNKTQGEDPVIHFYEHFLSAYNKKLKIQRGVFYTPQPVVSYIVRSVHELLQTEFGLEDGLASTVTWGEMLKRNPDLKLPDLSDDPKYPKPLSESEYFVQILDPATGTATFLVEAIDVIYNRLKAKWKNGGLPSMPTLPNTANCNCQLFTDFWNLYVPKCLLPRLHGYELLMAPYAIAHMKIGLKLAETGYRFDTEERVRIYLTNALEPKVKQLPQIGFEALAHEAAAVNEVKWYKRFTVIIGNPPYSGHSSNTGEWIESLVDSYFLVKGKPLNESNSKWLRDDYVKFLRLGQHILGSTGCGAFSFITNHGYIDNPTFRGMRSDFLESFPKIWLSDLHGNLKKKEKTEDGGYDENVFDIQQGVAIFLAKMGTKEDKFIRHCHVKGTREEKYKILANTTSLALAKDIVISTAPFYLFVPQNQCVRKEYDDFAPMNTSSIENSLGILTKRDSLVVAFSKSELIEKLTKFADASISDDKISTDFGIPLTDNDKWNLKNVRKIHRCVNQQQIRAILYRPFDFRYVYYNATLIARMNQRIFRHLEKNVRDFSFILGRQGMATGSTIWDVCFVCISLADQNIYRRGGGTIFPLKLSRSGQELGLDDCRLNLPHEITGHFERISATPEDIFNYIYAVFHSPIYRTRYAEFLKMDFPRLPLTSRLELFHSLATFGGDLVALHLMESPKLASPISHWIGDQKQEVEKVTYSDETVWIDKAKRSGFKGVPEAVWAFHIGGYQVCEKWLKDRKGRTLTDDDITHYHKIVVALSETIRIMSEIDTIITNHGGWPGAFAERKEQEGAAHGN